MIRKVRPKAKYNCLNPEDIDPLKYYTFSYNPEEQPLFERFYKMKLNNLADWSNKMKQIFDSLRYAKIEVNLEVSRRGRFHMHGVIKISMPLEFVIHDLKMLAHYGTYEIDSITDNEKWVKYCCKQQRLIEKYAHKNNMFSSYSQFGDSQLNDN